MAVTILQILSVLVALVCLGFLGYWFICWKQGDCLFRLYTRRITPFKVDSMELGRVTLSAELPIRNVGKQNGTIMDMFGRAYLPQEQFDKVRVHTLVMDKERQRDDDYWEAKIVEKGSQVDLIVKVILTGRSGNVLRDVDGIPDIPIDIIYQVVGRSDWYYAKERIYLNAEELRSALYTYTTGGKE
jgi:hypothetical protein